MKKILTKSNIFLLIFYLIAAGAIALVLNFFEPPIGQALALVIGLSAFIAPFVLRNPNLGLFLIGFFLPFERIPTIELGGLTLKINHILILVVLVCYLISHLVRKKLVIPKDPIRLLVVIFVMLLALSIPFAINQTRSLTVLAFMILMFLVYFTVTLVAQEKEAIVMAVKGIIWGALIASIFGLFQFFGDMIGLPNEITLLKLGYDKSTFGFARVQAFSQEPLYFANYIFIPLLITLLLLIQGQIKTIFNKTFAYLLVGALLVNFILAISRGAYLAAGVVLVVLLISQAKNIFRIKTIVGVLALAIFVLGGAYLALLKSEPQALDEFISHVAVEDRFVGESVVSRVDATVQALDLYQNQPYLGVGLGNFGPVVQGDPTDVPDEGWSIVNNEYLELLAETGLVGLAGFLILMAAVFIRSLMAYFRSRDKFLKALLAGSLLALVAILAQYATFSTLYIFHFWFLIGLIGAISNLIVKQDAK